MKGCLGFFVWAFVATFMTGAFAQEGSCYKPGRLTDVCLRMKHLQDHIAILDEQRDLLQLNFPLLVEVSDSMVTTIDELTRSGRMSDHIRVMEEMREGLLVFGRFAQAKDPQALLFAASVSTSCQECHNDQNQTIPDVSTGWETVLSHCNEPGRNPYVCKHMHALNRNYDFYLSGQKIDRLHRGLAAANAREMQRLANNLLEMVGPVHEGGNNSIKAVAKAADELAEAADQGGDVFAASRQVMEPCQRCHSR